ncbi:glycosyl hydrolase family 95 catalytic domain-containing protein [Chitinophaga sp.]|uniref:glycosyl hydrolase family 95 catalytic domain-containing protein n=1 Tax=Chitinophaga sp. TaxID=1869181 RepID=UPI002C229280|nr:glycoside hydrolase N-terminal domain-containing protein [Chitinophaga sp.]HWV66557.1 glycoside hydrolase N-terminal domain-containing protein [Chitinophaga sp.]
MQRFLYVCLWICLAVSSQAQNSSAVLNADKLKKYVASFNRLDTGEVKQYVPDERAAAWLESNIPLFDCPDNVIEQTYYFRWWSFRKHLKQTPDGFIFTEFIIPVKHAGRYNALSCALGHHIYEGRWLRDTQYVNQYIRYWLEKDPQQAKPRFHQFSSWAADAVYNYYLANANRAFAVSLLDSLDNDYRLWEQERGLPDGMYWQFDVKDGMEESISGSRRERNIRPTINSYMYGNARALTQLAAMAGRDSLRQRYTQLAAQLKAGVQNRLWDDTAAFFKVQLAKGPLSGVREEIGFIPWYFNLPDDNKEYAKAWTQLTDKNGFDAPWGLTTAEQRHPAFRSHGSGGCEWDGAIWPFATTQTLKGLANLLTRYHYHDAMTARVYFRALQTYARSHQKNGHPYLGEYQDEKNGYWLKGDDPRSSYYNHSGFCDLVISDLIGLKPREDEQLELHPLIPPGAWDWFCLDQVPYHGRLLTILWDKSGNRYHKGKGFQVFADGKKLYNGADLAPVIIPLPARKDELTLWYDRPAAKWTAALPVGNGRLGAMIFGGVNVEHLQFNESTLWTDGPREHARPGAVQYLPQIRALLAAGRRKEAEQLAEDHFMGLKSAAPASRYEADYQPFGDLWLWFKDTAAAATDYKRMLDLTTAVARTTYSANNVQYTREYFASAPQQAIVMRLSADKPGSISFTATLKSPQPSYATRKINDSTIALSLKVQNGVLKGESWLKVSTQQGRVTVTDSSITITNANAATLYLTAATSYRNYKDVSADPASQNRKVIQSLPSSYNSIYNTHIKDYQQYFNTFSISLGQGQTQLPTDQRISRFTAATDPALAALYMQYARYLMISGSRPGGQPLNLQGIWNDQLSPPWGSKYTTNINLEMNYWPAEVLHLSTCAEPLFAMILELSEAGHHTAAEHYGAPGWVLHHNTDLWRGTAPINASNHGIWVTGAAWLCHHLWEHYQYTKNKTFLQQQAYPLMKAAADFFVHFLVKDPATGWLISTPSNSPENGGLVAGPTMDHQLIRDLFRNCIAASEILQQDVAFRKTLQEKYKQIAPNQVGKHGQLQEWLQDVDDPENHHRHVSHLWGVFPGTDITWDQSPSLMNAARQSLLFRGDDGTGWSLAWKINLWARFKDGNHALTMINKLLTPAEGPTGKAHGGSYINLFDAHPPFQIDGNFGGASGMAEMLVQSHMGYIDLLPALPDAWPSGQVNGICARGGFVLDIRWLQGRLEQLTVTATSDGSCELRYKEQTVKFAAKKGKSYQVKVIAGQLKIAT